MTMLGKKYCLYVRELYNLYLRSVFNNKTVPPSLGKLVLCTVYKYICGL